MNVYEMIDRELKKEKLVGDSSVVLEPKPIKIKGFAKHALQRFKDRKATEEMAQHYIDTALIMVKESKDKYEFVSEDGSSVILEYGKLLTVIPRANYTVNQEAKMEVILSCLKSMTM